MLFLDFETRSKVNLKTVGVYAYAHHPSTEIVCTGYAFDDDEVCVTSGCLVTRTSVETFRDEVYVAHNAQMERELIHAATGIRLPWNRFIDTAALGARMSMPRKLEALAHALKLDEQKDMAGHRIMLKLARPKGGWDDDEFWEEEDKPEDFAALREYCRQDVEVMRAIYKRLLPLSDTEAKLYNLTGRMNDRGVKVDLASIPKAIELLDVASRDEITEFEALSGGHSVKSYKFVAKAFGLPDVQKVTVRNAIRHGFVEKKVVTGLSNKVVRFPEVGTFPPNTIRALTLFKKLARSSPAKLRAMQNRASKDGRVRGVLIYSGAERTQRWSSGGVQAHNFPKGLGEGTELAFAALQNDCLDLCYEDPVGTVADMLRGFITGPLLVGDYSQIEARLLNWFAEQADMLALFAANKDPYVYMASKIAGRQVGKEDTDPKFPVGVTWRFIGKQTVLGCGYGLGWQKFQRALDEVFDVQLDADLCMRTVATFRQASPKVVAWWGRLESGFKYVVERDVERVQVCKRVAMGNVRVGGLRYAYVELPSGRKLYYAEPEMTCDGVRYWGRNIYKGGKWDRVSTYGGKLAENVVQATARDLLAHAMLGADEAGFPLILQVHDEIVSEADGIHLLDGLKDIMLRTPSWAEGLPVNVSTFETRRYRK